MQTRTFRKWGSTTATVAGLFLTVGFTMKPTFDLQVDPDHWQLLHKFLGVGSALALLGLTRLYAEVHDRDAGWGLAAFLFLFLSVFLAGAHFTIYENHVTPVALQLAPETLAADHPIHLALLDCVRASRAFNVIAIVLFLGFVVKTKPPKTEVAIGTALGLGWLGVTFWLLLPLAVAKTAAIVAAVAFVGSGIALQRRIRRN